MEFKDYYATLGVSKSASEKEIKQAFRKLARKHHPDVNPGDKAAEAKFKEINEAYEVLGDPEKRRKYDELGANWRMYEQAQQQGQGWPGGAPAAVRRIRRRGSRRRRLDDQHGWSRRLSHDERRRDARHVRDGGSVLGFLPHVLRRRGGGGGTAGRADGRTPTRSQRGRDLEQEVELTLEEAYHGAMRRIGIEHGGQTRTVDVRIPAGVKAGTRVRAAGEGEPGANGGAAGDLFLRVAFGLTPSSSARATTSIQGRRARHDRRAGRRGAGPDRDRLGPA